MWGGYSGDSMAATGPKRSASGSGSGEEGFTRCSSHTDSATSSTRRCAGRHRQAMMLRISVATLGRSASTPAHGRGRQGSEAHLVANESARIGRM